MKITAFLLANAVRFFALHKTRFVSGLVRADKQLALIPRVISNRLPSSVLVSEQALPPGIR